MRFSLGLLMAQLLTMAVILATLRTAHLHPDWYPASIIVGMTWWMIVAWLTSCPWLMSEIERLLFLTVVVPIVFGGAVVTGWVAVSATYVILLGLGRFEAFKIRHWEMLIVGGWIALMVVVYRWTKYKAATLQARE